MTLLDVLVAPRTRRGTPVTTATDCELYAAGTKLRCHRHRFIDYRQVAMAYRIDDRVAQR
jgi:hypothetical protein